MAAARRAVMFADLAVSLRNMRLASDARSGVRRSLRDCRLARLRRFFLADRGHAGHGSSVFLLVRRLQVAWPARALRCGAAIPAQASRGADYGARRRSSRPPGPSLAQRMPPLLVWERGGHDWSGARPSLCGSRSRIADGIGPSQGRIVAWGLGGWHPEHVWFVFGNAPERGASAWRGSAALASAVFCGVGAVPLMCV